MPCVVNFYGREFFFAYKINLEAEFLKPFDATSRLYNVPFQDQEKINRVLQRVCTRCENRKKVNRYQLIVIPKLREARALEFHTLKKVIKKDRN